MHVKAGKYKGQKIKITRGIFETVVVASSKPCAMCGNSAEWVGSFIPRDPGAFGAVEGQAIYFPLCGGCFRDYQKAPDGFLGLLEEYLTRAGIRGNVDGKSDLQ